MDSKELKRQIMELIKKIQDIKTLEMLYYIIEPLTK